METQESDNRIRSLFWLSYIAVIIASAIVGTFAVIFTNSYLLGIALYFLVNIILGWALIQSFLKLDENTQ